MKKPCTINGVHYESALAAAKALGILTTTLQNRLTSPIFPEYRSKHRPKKSFGRKLIPCSVDGIEYRSIGSAARELGISPHQMRSRLTSFDYPGYVCAEYPKRKFQSRQGKPCTVNGVHYKSEKVAAQNIGMSMSGLQRRLKSSNFPEYRSQYRSKEKRRPFISCTIDGVEYQNIKHAVKELGIPAKLIRKRLASFRYPGYISVEIPQKKHEVEYTYKVNGKEYRTLQEIANVEGVSREHIRQKMNKPHYAGYERFLLLRGQPASKIK